MSSGYRERPLLKRYRAAVDEAIQRFHEGAPSVTDDELRDVDDSLRIGDPPSDCAIKVLQRRLR